MPPRKNKPEPKRGELRRAITLTLEADDETLNRLAAVLLFARYPHLDKTGPAKGLGPLPWEDADEGEHDKEPPALDPTAAREEIARALQQYIARHGVELARRLLAEYEAGKISELPESRLSEVLTDLRRSLAPPRKPLTWLK